MQERKAAKKTIVAFEDLRIVRREKDKSINFAKSKTLFALACIIRGVRSLVIISEKLSNTRVITIKPYDGFEQIKWPFGLAAGYTCFIQVSIPHQVSHYTYRDFAEAENWSTFTRSRFWSWLSDMGGTSPAKTDHMTSTIIQMPYKTRNLILSTREIEVLKSSSRLTLFALPQAIDARYLSWFPNRSGSTERAAQQVMATLVIAKPAWREILSWNQGREAPYFISIGLLEPPFIISPLYSQKRLNSWKQPVCNGGCRRFLHLDFFSNFNDVSLQVFLCLRVLSVLWSSILWDNVIQFNKESFLVLTMHFPSLSTVAYSRQSNSVLPRYQYFLGFRVS